jgi:hypothetical protein
MLDKDFAEAGSGNSAPVVSSSRLALSQYSQNSPVLNPYPTHKALPGFFLCIFSSLTYLKKLVFNKGDLPCPKVPARLY